MKKRSVIVFANFGKGFQSFPIKVRAKRRKAETKAAKKACRLLALPQPKPQAMPFDGCGKRYFSTICRDTQGDVLLTASIGRHSG